MIQDDPGLTGVAAVLFDEFHERSLDADLGLALARERSRPARGPAAAGMSATLDGAAVARLLDDAPVIESLGRAFPVDTRYLGRRSGARLEDQMARAVRRPWRRARLGAGLPAGGRGKSGARRISGRGVHVPQSISCRCTAPWTRVQDRAMRRRRRAGARWCWRPRSPRPA